jgi:hypothetical protein
MVGHHIASGYGTRIRNNRPSEPLGGEALVQNGDSKEVPGWGSAGSPSFVKTLGKKMGKE